MNVINHVITNDNIPGLHVAFLKGLDWNWESLKSKRTPIYYVNSIGRYTNEEINITKLDNLQEARRWRNWLAESHKEIFKYVFVINGYETIQMNSIKCWPDYIDYFDPMI